MNTPSFGEKDFYLWVLVYQVQDAIFKARGKELSQYGVTARETATMHAIHSMGGKATPAEISRWTFREHHTVTALLGRMEKKGLVYGS